MYKSIAVRQAAMCLCNCFSSTSGPCASKVLGTQETHGARVWSVSLLHEKGLFDLTQPDTVVLGTHDAVPGVSTRPRFNIWMFFATIGRWVSCGGRRLELGRHVS